ncbi:secondary thiamine-phosphate synthase enzyme [Parcubacteria bacterium DG_74_3]|nr:MAG: secondary thiamine-phosphate synthase enzyme [Parcubacteria bacterium DG_74_3]
MRFTISTKGFTDIIDITPQVLEMVRKSKIKEGFCLVYCPGSTCGITTIEYEEGLIKDFKRILERVAPMSEDYEHCKKWGDCNGYAHIRSALLRPILTVPIENGKLVLGQWQNLVFIDFDNRPRKREISVKTIGN